MSNGGQQFGNSPYAAGGQFGAPGQYGNQMPMPPAKGSNTAVTIIIVVAVVLVLTLMACGVLIGLLLPAVQAAREAARRMQDSNNMKQVALAMHNHESVYKSFPMPAIVDADGQEVLSWHVQLLPFIEANSLYNQINIENPTSWSSPENAFLLQSTPMTYRSTRVESPAAMTNVFVIATNPGPPESIQAAFTHGESVPFREFKDGLANTILAIMLTQTAVEWTKPSALTPDVAVAAIQNEPMGVTVAMADGSVRFLSKSIDKATFMALCTRNGGEMVGAY